MNNKKRVSFNRSITVKEFNLRKQVDDDQTDQYMAPMDLTGLSVDSSTASEMELTEVITGPGEVTTIFNCNDTMLNDVTRDSEKSDMSIDRSLLDSQVVHNLSVMQSDQIANSKMLNVTTVDTPEPVAEFTMLQNDILRSVQAQEPTRSRRQSPRLAKRNSDELNKVNNKKAKSRDLQGAPTGLNESESLNHSLPTGSSQNNKKLKSGDKENMVAPTRSVSESFNRSLPTTAPQVIQKMITPRLSNAKRGRKKKSSDDNQSINQSLDQSSNQHNTSKRSSSRKKSAAVSAVQDIQPPQQPSRKSSIKSNDQSLFLNSVNNITLLDVTVPIVSTSQSQQQSNLFHNESDIDLLEPSLTHHEIIREVGNKVGEETMIIELDIKVQQLDLKTETKKAELERIDLELEQKKKELNLMPDDHAIAIFKAIYGENWDA